MPRFLLAVLLLLTAAILQAQVAVTSSGYATQAGAVVPAAVPSPPLMFTPSVHLGEAPTTGSANGPAHGGRGRSTTRSTVANRSGRTALQFRSGPVLNPDEYECATLGCGRSRSQDEGREVFYLREKLQQQ